MLVEGESRDFEKIITEDYSSDNERDTLIDLCENRYNIEIQNDKEETESKKEEKSVDSKLNDKKDTKKNELNKENNDFKNLRKSEFKIHRPPQINKNNITSFSHPKRFYPKSKIFENSSSKSRLEHLKELAQEEAQKLNTKIYEKKSYSPKYEEKIEVQEPPKRERRRGRPRTEIDYTEPSKLSDVSEKRGRPRIEVSTLADLSQNFSRERRGRPRTEISTLTNLSQFSDVYEISSESDETQKTKKRPASPAGEKRSYRKRKQFEYVPSEAAIDMTEQPPIESFADFADSMFTFYTKGKTKVFECPKPGCFTELPSLSRIKRHYLIHTNLKPFKCPNPTCGKWFSRKDNMTQHFKTHCDTKSRRK